MGFTNCETVEKKGFQKFNKGKKSSYKRDKKVGNQANMSGENKSTRFLPWIAAIVKASDITDELKEDILAISKDALDNFQLERDIAGTVKKQLDVKYGNTWHVIVGKNFGSYVTHEKGHFVYFYIGPLAFLVFKTA